ncbi:MAG TPA: VWA domain-containing protein [Gaiellaceae bacterium]|nr:VWA domain-containing protein [Gaiellaceae bacterium]
MELRFVTPYGALFALAAVLPVGVLLLRERRLRAIRRALGLAVPSLRALLPLAVALAAVPALLGLAAAQPVLHTTRTVNERTDAQAFVVVDISRSMLAAARSGAPTRFDRARELALALRQEIPEVPVGLASLTDRVLPHVFPTTDARVFAAALLRSVGVEHPPPGSFYLTVATSLNALRALPERSYFPPSARKRLAVVLTDGETELLTPDLARAYRRRPRVEVVFVHLWDAEERIYETGVAEGGYRPDARSAAHLARAAELTGGRVFSEGERAEIAAAVRGALGSGEVVSRAQDAGRLPLMPWVTLAALVPLGLVLLRRNVWWSRRGRLLLAARRARAAPVPEGATLSPARGVAQPG